MEFTNSAKISGYYLKVPLGLRDTNVERRKERNLAVDFWASGYQPAGPY